MDVVVGFLKVLGISMVPVALFGALIHARAAWERVAVVLRRSGVLPAATSAPVGPPLEQLASDLRRLRPQVRHPAPGVPMAKQRGTVAAYDERLVGTAAALGVDTTLPALPAHGLHREAERLRLEHALERAGLHW